MRLASVTNALSRAWAHLSRSQHAWCYAEGRDVRTCSVCGRSEHYVLDLVTSYWEESTPGDARLHLARAPASSKSPATLDAALPACAQAAPPAP